MLSELLTREECAKCQICCSFDDYDLWETPIIDTDLKKKIVELKPEQKFVTKGSSSLLKLDKNDENGLYYCTMLDKSCGCVLSDEKPFDCRIWPFRVMKLGENMVITLSMVCPIVQKRGLDVIKRVCDSLAPTIYKMADENPDIIKEYNENQPIINVRGF